MISGGSKIDVVDARARCDQKCIRNKGSRMVSLSTPPFLCIFAFGGLPNAKLYKKGCHSDSGKSVNTWKGRSNGRPTKSKRIKRKLKQKSRFLASQKNPFLIDLPFSAFWIFRGSARPSFFCISVFSVVAVASLFIQFCVSGASQSENT